MLSPAWGSTLPTSLIERLNTEYNDIVSYRLGFVVVRVGRVRLAGGAEDPSVVQLEPQAAFAVALRVRRHYVNRLERKQRAGQAGSYLPFQTDRRMSCRIRDIPERGPRRARNSGRAESSPKESTWRALPVSRTAGTLFGRGARVLLQDSVAIARRRHGMRGDRDAQSPRAQSSTPLG
jgi:hypothetical protein